MRTTLLLSAAALLLGSAGAWAQTPPCPDPNVGVQPECLPAPPWTHHRNIVIMPNGCRALVDWCDQWVCRGYAGLSRSRVSISNIHYLDTNCFGGTLDEQLGELLKAMVAQNILPSDGPPKYCSDPTNEDHLYEVMTSRCYTTYKWRGAVFEGGLTGGGTPVYYPFHDGTRSIAFCTGEQICLRKWKICRMPDGSLTKQLAEAYAADAQGNRLPAGTWTDCDPQYADHPFSLNGDWSTVDSTYTIGITMSELDDRTGCDISCFP
jgi:hypothetical protein